MVETSTPTASSHHRVWFRDSRRSPDLVRGVKDRRARRHGGRSRYYPHGYPYRPTSGVSGVPSPLSGRGEGPRSPSWVISTYRHGRRTPWASPSPSVPRSRTTTPTLVPTEGHLRCLGGPGSPSRPVLAKDVKLEIQVVDGCSGRPSYDQEGPRTKVPVVMRRLLRGHRRTTQSQDHRSVSTVDVTRGSLSGRHVLKPRDTSRCRHGSRQLRRGGRTCPRPCPTPHRDWSPEDGILRLDVPTADGCEKGRHAEARTVEGSRGETVRPRPKIFEQRSSSCVGTRPKHSGTLTRR